MLTNEIDVAKRLAEKAMLTVRSLSEQVSRFGLSSEQVDAFAQCQAAYETLQSVADAGDAWYIYSYMNKLQAFAYGLERLCELFAVNQREESLPVVSDLSHCVLDIEEVINGFFSASRDNSQSALEQVRLLTESTKDRLDRLVSEANNKILDVNKAQDQLSNKVNESLTFISTAMPSLKESIALAGGKSGATFFSISAKREYWIAGIFNASTFVCAGVLIYFAVYTYLREVELFKSISAVSLSSTNVNSTIGLFHYWIAGLPVTIFLTLLIALLAKEASWHKNQAAQLRRLSLNLSTLSPFVAELDPVSKSALIVTISEAIFTHDGKNSLEVPTVNVSELALELARQMGGIKTPKV